MQVQFHQDQIHFLIVHETQLAIYETTNLECEKQVICLLSVDCQLKIKDKDLSLSLSLFLWLDFGPQIVSNLKSPFYLDLCPSICLTFLSRLFCFLVLLLVGCGGVFTAYIPCNLFM